MKKYTRKQAERIVSERGHIWSNAHDLARINRIACETKDEELYQATLDLNGYVIGY